MVLTLLAVALWGSVAAFLLLVAYDLWRMMFVVWSRPPIGAYLLPLAVLVSAVSCLAIVGGLLTGGVQ